MKLYYIFVTSSNLPHKHRSPGLPAVTWAAWSALSVSPSAHSTCSHVPCYSVNTPLTLLFITYKQCLFLFITWLNSKCKKPVKNHILWQVSSLFCGVTAGRTCSTWRTSTYLTRWLQIISHANAGDLILVTLVRGQSINHLPDNTYFDSHLTLGKLRFCLLVWQGNLLDSSKLTFLDSSKLTFKGQTSDSCIFMKELVMMYEFWGLVSTLSSQCCFVAEVVCCTFM